LLIAEEQTMNFKKGYFFLFLLVLISACKIDMTTDVYLSDIEDVALTNAEGLKTSGLLQVGVANCADKENLSQVTRLLRDYFLKVTEKSCESGMESLLTIGVDIPIIHSEIGWTSKTKSTTALITKQSKDGSSILVNFALNKTKFGNLNKAIESQYFQKLSIGESTVSFSINNDARHDEGLIVSDSFVDGKPIVFPKRLILSSRNKIDLEPSDVRRITFSEQGMMPVFEIPIINLKKAKKNKKSKKKYMG